MELCVEKWNKQFLLCIFVNLFVLWAVCLGVSLKWHFCPAMLIISEDILVTAPSDGAGRKEVCNHVQLVPLRNMIKPFHCANYLFVPIICFAELVNPRVHLDCKRSCCEERFTVWLLTGWTTVCLICFWAQLFVSAEVLFKLFWSFLQYSFWDVWSN